MHVMVGWIELFFFRGSWRGRRSVLRRCWRRVHAGVERGVDAGIDVHLRLEIVSLILELIAELARHGARAPNPAADLLGELGQLLWSEHDQGDREDQQKF